MLSLRGWVTWSILLSKQEHPKLGSSSHCSTTETKVLQAAERYIAKRKVAVADLSENSFIVQDVKQGFSLAKFQYTVHLFGVNYKSDAN